MLELFDRVETRLPGRRSRLRPLGTCRLKQREVLNKKRDKYRARLRQRAHKFIGGTLIEFLFLVVP